MLGSQLLQHQQSSQCVRELLASLHLLHTCILSTIGPQRLLHQHPTSALSSKQCSRGQKNGTMPQRPQQQQQQHKQQHKQEGVQQYMQQHVTSCSKPAAGAGMCPSHSPRPLAANPSWHRPWHSGRPSHQHLDSLWSQHMHVAAVSSAATAHQDAAPAPAPPSQHKPPNGQITPHLTSQQQTMQQTAKPLVKQAPVAPGTPPGPPAAFTRQQQQGRQLAARHLRQYLQSINSSGFVEGLVQGIRAGDRLAISRSLTLCESTRPDHALQAAALLRKLIDDNAEAKLQQQQRQRQRQQSEQQSSNREHAQHGQLSQPQQQQQGQPNPSPAQSAPQGAHASTAATQQHPDTTTTTTTTSSSSSSVALRIGLSGPPGAGKSSLIETWGCYLADQGSRVAVLAVDPSSMESGGAILGDKTRMSRLSSHVNAYVRPSPARGTLGGVSRATFDAMLICEAAGYDRILVETVGVGQSEVAVADLVDCMMLVMPPVGGDDLQMIKRGIMEVADVVAVNKADGDTEKAASRAASEYSGCLHLMPHRYRAWEPQALCVSAHTGKGVPALARLVSQFQQALTDSGELQRCRVQRAESVAWLSLEEQLLEGLRQDPHVRWLLGRLLPMVRAGTMAPRSAADIALAYFYQHCS